ncbi:MAG: hypothetical protein AABM42_03055 [Actinomycetota bacterium]
MATRTTRNAWAELESRLEGFEAAKRAVVEVGARRGAAQRAVAAAEARLRAVYVEIDEEPAAIAEARAALTEARAEAEPAVWEGRLQGAQDVADRTGSELEDHVRANLEGLVAELVPTSEAARQRLEAAWGETQASVAEWDAIERRWRRLCELLGREVDTPDNPLAPVLLAAQAAGARAPRPFASPSSPGLESSAARKR